MKNFLFGAITKPRLSPLAAGLIILGTLSQAADAQGILGNNLIVNGNAEAGAAGVNVPPGWTGTTGVNVGSYGVTGSYLLTESAPPDHGFQYFASTGSNPVIVQKIDVSSGASAISAGNVKFTASAYLGSLVPSDYAGSAQVAVAFENAKGQIFSTTTLGPLPGTTFAGRGGTMFLQQQIGLVPAGTVTIAVTLSLTSFNGGIGVADSLSLVLTTLGTSPATILGSNLVMNPGAESGPGTGLYIPSWSTNGPSVAPYGGSGFISATAPGPPDRGVNLFYGNGGNIYQDIDVSAAGSMIDGGQVKYQISAWLGALGDNPSAVLSYIFFDWSGNQLAPTAQLTGTSNATALSLASNFAGLPAGTRRVHISVAFSFTAGSSLADNISFVIGAQAAPFITSESTVPVYSTSTTIQPGSWVSVFGTGLASTTATWNGDFPLSLAGTSVTINSKPAYLWFVSPTQINLQAPDDPSAGPVSVVVTTAAGSATSTVTLGQYAPSFSMFNGKYPAAIVLTPGSAGNSGNGYDYIGPGGNGLPFVSRPVKAGETILLYGVGFGPTTPPVAAGAAFAGAAPCPILPTVTIGGVSAKVTFAGIVEAGLFQFNVVVPSAGSGDKALLASIGGMTTPASVLLSLQ